MASAGCRNCWGTSASSGCARDERQRAPVAARVGGGSGKLTEAVSLMEANLGEPLPTEDIARLVGVSRRQLERLFKQHLDALPSRYYGELRLTRARRLLQQTSQSILQMGWAAAFRRDRISAMPTAPATAARRTKNAANALPSDRAKLQARLERSAQAFTSLDDSSGEEIHPFVVEDLGAAGGPRVVGTSGIAASAGFHDRFHTYRNEMVVHVSAALQASNRIHTLHLCHDLTGYTLLTSFYIEPAYQHTLAPPLLSRARLFFIAEFAERFSDRIAAESPGLADDSGRCPF